MKTHWQRQGDKQKHLDFAKKHLVFKSQKPIPDATNAVLFLITGPNTKNGHRKCNLI